MQKNRRQTRQLARRVVDIFLDVQKDIGPAGAGFLKIIPIQTYAGMNVSMPTSGLETSFHAGVGHNGNSNIL